MGHILKIAPVFKEMIWGGKRLAEEYGYQIPGSHTGECWAISAHPNGDCLISEGEYANWHLSTLWQAHRELFGHVQADQFPLLVKLIDASQDLSVQVHPDNEYALKHENSLGKSECWYVLDCKPGTKLVMGHHAKSKEELKKMIANDDYDQLLNIIDIKTGDFFYIPAGTLHAICKGTLIYEAQQSSDITYRVYDYHRKDANGKERQLHVSQSIDVINVPALSNQSVAHKKTQLENGVLTTMVEADAFSVEKLAVNGLCHLSSQKPFLMFSVINGQGYMEDKEIKKGDHFIICSDQPQVQFDGKFEAMICHL